ncbi:MAG: hypothetical protein EAZ61_03850 [Oscillatoriales cyanobacterium]|nr:MAG: hypothetical protein EAZ61_03850 [Oscillatoriales cyanobacterium]
MLLHSWLHAIHFLAGAFTPAIGIGLLNAPPSPLPLVTARTDLAPTSSQPTDNSHQELSPSDRSYQRCMVTFETLATPRGTTLGIEPMSDPPDERLGLTGAVTSGDSVGSVGAIDATATTLTSNPVPVLTAPGIALYRQTYQDDRNNQDVDDVHGMAIEANDATPGDQSTAQAATTLIYQLDLSQGAQLDLAGSIVIDPANPQLQPNAAYDTQRDPHVPPRSLDDHWQAIRTAHPDRAFAAINGQFFGATPIRLAFPVKAQGEIISGGYAGSSEYAGEKLMFAIADQVATITPFPEQGQPDSPLFSTIPDLIVGLHPCADKGRDRAVGRTFLGIADRNGDGQAETVLILVASHATQTEAIVALQRFGAIAAVMLDGGGSTQAIALGETYLTSSDPHPRAIPHAIGLLSGMDVLPTSER